VDITVAICTWNRSESLAETLRGFTRLRVPAGTNWELLIVNNCCTDDTDAVVRRFSESLPSRSLYEPTPGQAFARNTAIAEARGRLLFWTDDDVIVDGDWLTNLRQALERTSADFVFGPSQPHWPGHVPRWYSDRFRGSFAVLDYGREAFIVTERRWPFFGLNFGGTLEAHRALGGFRNEFGLRGKGGGVGEDIEFFERALGAGMRVLYTPDALVSHVIPPTRTRKSYHRRRQWVSNGVVYRHLPELFPGVRWTFGLPRFLLGKGVRDALSYVRSVAAGDSSAAFFYELQLVRLVRLVMEAAGQGFRNPLREGTSEAGTRKAS
jgi:glycosyltransferase involved in cell wall biosynthesis